MAGLPPVGQTIVLCRLLGRAFRPRNGMKNRRSCRRLHWPTGDKIAGVTGSPDRFFDPVFFVMTFLLAIALLTTSALAADPPKNALSNPSFEAGLDSWDTAGGAIGISVDEAVAHFGKQSARVTGSTLKSAGGVHQSIHLGKAVQHPILVSGWSKAREVETAGGGYVIFLDGRYEDGTQMPREDVAFDAGTHDWQYREFIVDPPKPVKSLELFAVLAQGKGTVWFDDLAIGLAPIAFRGVRLVTGIFGGPSFGLVAGLTVKAPWQAQLRNSAGVVATAEGAGAPILFQWAGPKGNYTLRVTATDPVSTEKIEEVRTLGLSSAASPRSYAAWVESSMKRVLPQALPPASPPQLEAQISLAGNERESFQLCLLAAPGKAIHNVRLMPGDLMSSAGNRIPAADIEWQQVGYVRVGPLRHSPANEGAWAGWWPDPLLPVAQFDLQPGFTQPVWVTIHTPSGTPAGDYSGALRLLADGQPPLRVPVKARVYAFSLPAESHLKTAFALLGEELEAIYGRPVPQQLRWRYGEFMLQHRLNADDIYRKELPDLADLRHFRELGLSAFNLLYLIPQHGSLIPDLNAYTPELRQNLLDRLAPTTAKLRAAGMLDRAYVYGFDESDPEFFPVMRDYFGAIKQRDPQLHTMTTAHIPLDPAVLKSLHVDWIIPLTSNYDFQKAEQCRRAGIQVWSYVACDPREPYANFLADDALIEARVLWWQAWQQKMDGMLYWGANIWERRGNRRSIDLSRGPLLDWGVTTGKSNDERWLQELHGDGLLLYPGIDGPIGSIRLANLRDGLEDYEYLWMLGQREAALPVTKDLTHFTLDPAVLYTQRDRVARQIHPRH